MHRAGGEERKKKRKGGEGLRGKPIFLGGGGREGEIKRNKKKGGGGKIFSENTYPLEERGKKAVFFAKEGRGKRKKRTFKRVTGTLRGGKKGKGKGEFTAGAVCGIGLSEKREKNP